MSEEKRFVSYQINTTQLLHAIDESYNMEEFKTLCYTLRIEYDNLEATGKTNQARELVKVCERTKRLSELVAIILKERPSLDFHNFYWDASNDQSPYKGLLVFEEKDSAIFFGRETLITELVERLREHTRKVHFLALVGASGSGKSSIVRAGLIPALRRKTNWSIHLITPTAEPLEDLATTLTLTSESVTATATLVDDMLQDSRSLRLYISRMVTKDASKEELGTTPHEDHLVLVVDQFEDLFTHCKDEKVQRAFINNLAEAVKDNTGGRITVVITLRADFYNHCLQYDALHKLLEDEQKIVRTMNEADLSASIVDPARQSGLEFDAGLVDVILQDVGQEPGILPLLSHALLETWKRRDGNRLTLAGYIGAGGIKGAIAQTAESTYDRFTSKQQVICREIFLHLTTIIDEDIFSRRVLKSDVLFAYVCGVSTKESEVIEVLDTLIEERLLYVDSNGITLSHDALIKKWERLNQWLQDTKRNKIAHRLLQQNTKWWSDHNCLDTYLYKGLQLDEALNIFPLDEIKTRYSRFLHPVKRFIYRVDRQDSQKPSQSEESFYSGGYAPLEKMFLSKSLESREKIWIKRSIGWLGIALLITFLPFLVYFLGKNLSAIDWYSGTWNAVEEFYGNKITAISVPKDASELYIGVDIAAINHSKILKSLDGGGTWNDFDQGLPELTITDIVKIPDKKNSIYASTLGAGIFSYDYDINSWIPINEGLSNFAIKDIAYKPDEPNKLFIAASGRSGGVYITNNSGSTWSLSNNGLTSENIFKVIVDPVAYDRVYAVTELQGIFKSENGGKTWETFNSPSENVVSLIIHPYDNSHLFVATLRNGIFKSVDSGKNWEEINSGLPNIFQSREIVFSATNPDHIYLAANIYGGDKLYQSKDGGENWATLPINWSGVYVRTLVDDSNNGILVASISGLYHVTQQEELSSNRVPLMKFKLPGSSLAINADNSNLFMAVHGGIFRYQYGQDEWEFFDHGITHPVIRTLAADPIDPNRLYAGMFSDGASDALFVTNDKGESWNSLGTFQNGLENDDVRSIVIDPINTKVLYAGTYGSGVFKTIDRGENWAPINAGITELRTVKLVINPQNPEILYAVSERGPVFQTTNGGQLWQEMFETKDLDIRDLKLLPDSFQPCITVFGVFEGNIRCWTGNTWEFIGSGLDSSFVSRLEISESNPNTFFAGTNDKGVYWSQNKGKSWESINDGLGRTEIEFLLANPTEKNALYALVQSQGLFTFEPMYLWQRDQN